MASAAAKKAAAGDNIKAENERKALFFHHVRKRIAHNNTMREAREDRKKDGKLAQADGIKLEDLDFAVNAMETEDKRIISDSYIRHGEILDWLGLIPSFQPDLLRDRMPAVERIERQGELAGLSNKARESGYAKGSDEEQHWLRGYDKGQKTFKDNISDALENAEKTRQEGKTKLLKNGKTSDGKGGKKPGRPPKSASKAGKPLDGDTPDDEKKAANQNGAEQSEHQPTPPKPPAKSKDDEGLTNQEVETLRQANAMFN
jgi:ribosome modulation factor